MERIGLFSRDERDCIFNRRMKKDTEISESRKRAGEARVLDAERDDYGRLRPKGSPAVSPPTSPAEVQHPVQQNTDAPARMSVPAHDSASTSDSASDTDSVSSPYSSAMSSPNDAAALRANGGVGDVVEVGAAPTQPMQPGSVNGMQPSPIHDAAWFDFRITAERAGMTGSEPDWDEAWRFHWRRMDVGEQGAAHAGIVERTGTDDPVLKSLPTNYLKLKKWQRKTRAPDASPEEQRRARRQRELSERMKHL
jgi:hypothetical protein